MPLFIFGALIAGVWLLHRSKQPTPTSVYQQTYGGTQTTNLPAPISSVSKPKPVVHVIRRQPRDLNPQFKNRVDYLLAVKLNPDRRHLIPHMIVQEGGAIKYEDIRGGSQTIKIPGR